MSNLVVFIRLLYIDHINLLGCSIRASLCGSFQVSIKNLSLKRVNTVSFSSLTHYIVPSSPIKDKLYWLSCSNPSRCICCL